jgi:hypothetical protein
MPGPEFRSVGHDRLPSRLSEFDVGRYFALMDSEIATPNERFRPHWRPGAAIQLAFLPVSGHTLDHVGTFPRQLPRYIGEWLRQRFFYCVMLKRDWSDDYQRLTGRSLCDCPVRGKCHMVRVEVRRCSRMRPASSRWSIASCTVLRSPPSTASRIASR